MDRRIALLLQNGLAFVKTLNYLSRAWINNIIKWFKEQIFYLLSFTQEHIYIELNKKNK